MAIPAVIGTVIRSFARINTRFGAMPGSKSKTTESNQFFTVDVILRSNNVDLQKETEDFIEKTNLLYFTTLMQSLWKYTPVASGRARASWTLVDDPNKAVTLPPGFYGMPSMPQIPDSDVIYLVNTAEYSLYLDQGTIYRPPLFIVDRATADAEAATA